MMKMMLLMIICLLYIVTNQIVYGHTLQGDVHTNQHEKGNIVNITGEICYEKWKEMMNFNGRGLHKNHNYSSLLPAHVHPNNTEKILLVHVGKTGGTTVRNRLRTINKRFQTIHVHPVDHKMFDDYNVILIGLRHPVERILSAYYFTHPHEKGSIMRQNPSLITHIIREFYHCSPTLQDFANNLYESSRCGDVARGYPRDILRMHIYTGPCAYLAGISDVLFNTTEKKIFVLNSENMNDDLNYVSEQLNWGVNFSHEGFSTVRNKGRYTAPKHSAKSLMQISGYLALSGELAFYNKLQHRFSHSPIFV